MEKMKFNVIGMNKKQIALSVGIIALAVTSFVIGVRVQVNLHNKIDMIQAKVAEDYPMVTSCAFREIITIEREFGHQWPKGSESGCRCIIVWMGRSWVEYQNNSDNTMCQCEIYSVI